MVCWCYFDVVSPCSMLFDVLCDQKVVFLPNHFGWQFDTLCMGWNRFWSSMTWSAKIYKICLSHPAGGLCPANIIITPPAYCRNEMAKHQSISGEDGDQQLCSKSLTATSVVELFPVTSIDRNLDVHGTSVQYFFNEDRWFWYFDIKPFLRIRISQTWEHLTVIQHQETLQLEDWNWYFGLRTSTWTRNDLHTCKRSNSFPHFQWLPKVTENEDLQQLCENLAGLHRVVDALPAKWSPALQIAMPPFPRNLHSTALARIADSEAVPWDILLRKINIFFSSKSGCKLYPKAWNSFRH